MIGVNAERLVSVSLATGTQGSGYLLTPNLILTAGHCAGFVGSEVEVDRFGRNEHGRYELAEYSIFEVEAKSGEDALDFALLTPKGPAPDPLALGDKEQGQVRLGRLVGEDEVAAQALGFPASQVDTSLYMNVEDVRGSLLPRTGRRTARNAEAPIERLNFQISTGTPVRSADSSLWGGMSGAALFCGGHLLGVIVEDRARFEGRLHAIPVERIFGTDGHEEAKECLRQATGIDEIPIDPVWAGNAVVEPPYIPLPPPDQSSEADLLEARYNVVPFHGREDELKSLTEWCRESRNKVSMRLLSGSGAIGKTRLAREICRLMSAEGWVAGIVDPLRVDFSHVCSLNERRLLVVDDADARVGQLEALLSEVDRQDWQANRLRILVVGHGGGPWWQALKRRHEALVDRKDPAPLTSPDHSDREDVYNAALDAFRLWYQQKDLWDQEQGAMESSGKPMPGNDGAATGLASAPSTLNFRSHDFDSYLLILIQALVGARDSLEKSPTVAVIPASHSRADALLDYATDVERQRWQEAARSAGLPDDAVLLERIVAIAGMAVATGPTEGIGETEASRRLQLVPDLADEPEWRRRAFARWQHTQFPGDGYLRPLQPLRLAERLGARLLAAFPDLASQLLDVGGTGPGTPERLADKSHQVLNVLQLLQLTAESEGTGHERTTRGDIAGAECKVHREAREILETALREHATSLLRLVKQVAVNDEDGIARAIGSSLAAALNTTLQEGSAQLVAAEVFAELDEYCPDVLLELATSIADHAVAYYQRSDSPHTKENKAGLATALQRWSLYLANSGLRNRACEIAFEAVDNHQAVARTAPSAEHKRQLAEALSDLADRLNEVGRFEEAHDHAREAVRLLDDLYQQDPRQVDAFRFAKSLCTQATAANDIGRPREALQAATQACDLTRQLPGVAGAEEDEIKGKQAFALRGLAWQLGRNGRKDEALATAKEACAKYSDIFRHHPGRWQRDYAQALSICASRFEAKEEWDESIKRHKEAVDHYTTLEQQYREAVRPQHAIALRRLAGGYLGRAGSQMPRTPQNSMPSEQAEALEADLEDAQDRIEQAVKQYANMEDDDREANRLSEAVAHRLRAEILVAQGNIDKYLQLTRYSRTLKVAEKAAKESLKCYTNVSKHTWQSQFDMTQAQAILVRAMLGQGRSNNEVRNMCKEVNSRLLQLKAKEPGRADVKDALKLFKDFLKEFGDPSEPP